ncbi:MAG TPA: metalloregulator ArsR/SmtB family transcription factor [Drouetiella sp.]|jgi:DNA-binding transcriptional ArsR family regulator
MSSRRRRLASERQAQIFAALGDQTRLSLVARLSDGTARSITDLSDDHKLTRQAITKHLHVLEDVGLVRSVRSGRESIFELDTRPLNELQDYLSRVSSQWDDALARLKAFVEDET